MLFRANQTEDLVKNKIHQEEEMWKFAVQDQKTKSNVPDTSHDEALFHWQKLLCTGKEEPS